ncbi:Molybdenum cofactor biosynthesis protein A [Phytophthora cinnamomi]|uniref:Molybdenum cofactor biosynthesis protein A n=1 Tax=Phytophthora cinnamomi TaxID=4785 RepID=UPI003559B49B|nr:Molybdenum cofactor biosynthesis protein A [Phytophthora cinnamomi]
MHRLASSLPRRTARRSAALSTRAEWKRQVEEGPSLHDFLSNSRPKVNSSGAHAQQTTSSREESLQQIRQILAEIRESERRETAPAQLVDRFGRAHTYLRISLTERCNLRCRYCMPEEGVPLQPNQDLLTTPEIIRLAKLFASSGVKRIRLTVRGVTTNGITLQRKLLALQRAGADRLNISLDTLQPEKFAHITRRQGFTRVMNSIVEAQALGFAPLKINCVVQRHFNLDEIVGFVKFTEKHAVDVRFIEWMPFDSNRWNDETFVPFKEMMDLIKAVFPTVEKLHDGANDTSKAFHVPGFKGQFGFITSMSEHFAVRAIDFV